MRLGKSGEKESPAEGKVVAEKIAASQRGAAGWSIWREQVKMMAAPLAAALLVTAAATGINLGWVGIETGSPSGFVFILLQNGLAGAAAVGFWTWLFGFPHAEAFRRLHPVFGKTNEEFATLYGVSKAKFVEDNFRFQKPPENPKEPKDYYADFLALHPAFGKNDDEFSRLCGVSKEEFVRDTFSDFLKLHLVFGKTDYEFFTIFATSKEKFVEENITDFLKAHPILVKTEDEFRKLYGISKEQCVEEHFKFMRRPKHPMNQYDDFLMESYNRYFSQTVKYFLLANMVLGGLLVWITGPATGFIAAGLLSVVIGNVAAIRLHNQDNREFLEGRRPAPAATVAPYPIFNSQSPALRFEFFQPTTSFRDQGPETGLVILRGER